MDRTIPFLLVLAGAMALPSITLAAPYYLGWGAPAWCHGGGGGWYGGGWHSGDWDERRLGYGACRCWRRDPQTRSWFWVC